MFVLLPIHPPLFSLLGVRHGITVIVLVACDERNVKVNKAITGTEFDGIAEYIEQDHL